MIRLLLCCLVCFTGARASMVERPLGDAAKAFAEKLPAGCIVTGEWSGGEVFFAVAGNAEPADIPAERRVFEIGSISKVFTGLLLSEALLAKKVRLDSTLKELLGGERAFADPRVGEITLLQLATHTSGLPRLPSNMGWLNGLSKDPYKNYSRKNMLDFLAKARLDGPAPYPASYSNFGVGLLGELLAGVEGTTWEALVEKKITGPLGMKDTMAQPGAEQAARLAPPYDGGKPARSWTFQAMAGAGALRSTAADLILFGKALLTPDETPLGAAIKGMMEVRASHPDMGADIGLGIFIGTIDGRREYFHSGGTGGYRSMLQVIPERKLVRVVLVNNGEAATEDVIAATREETKR